MAHDDLSGFSMLDLFRVEVENHTTTLSDGLLALEKDPGDGASLEKLMRAAHSIKGAARLVGVDAAVKLAHVMEDCFVAAQAGKLVLQPAAVDTLLRGVDTLSLIAGEASDDGEQAPPEGTDALIGALNDVLAGKTSAAAAPPPPPVAAPEPAAKPTADDSMMELFRVEADTHTRTLSEGLLALEQQPDDSEQLERLMRAAHSIKGAARMVGMDAVVALAHVVEDCFVAAQSGKLSLEAADIDLLLRGVDQLTQAATGAADADADNDLIEALRARLAGGSPASAPAPSATETPPAPAARPAEAKEPAQPQDRVLRISAERINRLMGLAGEFRVSAGWIRTHTSSMLTLKKRQSELVALLDRLQTISEDFDLGDHARTLLREAHLKADDCRQALASRLAELDDFDRRTGNLSGRLSHEVISSRMRPFGDGVHGFQRMVRDVARSLGKQVELQIVGTDTQVDRDILDKIEAPLNHILRNAVDHGIERPDERVAAGKRAQGTIILEALHNAGMLSIVVKDDGRGVDLDKLRRKIIAKGMVSEAMARDLSESELLDFLFLPSFSTRDEVTEISGRGVGLDVVHNAVQEMRGQIRASTKPGRGLRLNLQLPLTLSVVRSLMVEIGGELYAFPLARVESIIKVDRSAIATVEDRQFITHNGQHIGLVDATQVLGCNAGDNTNEFLPVVIIGDRTHSYGVVVGQFAGERELAVHALDPRLGKVQDVAAAAVTETGEPLLILDVDDMLRSIENLVSGRRLSKVREAADDHVSSGKRVLIVDDSLTVREVERKLLESRGYEVDVAVDGMDGWNTVRLGSYDLVISDVDMPRMNGIEFVGLIKGDPKLRALPVMIVSYKDRPEDRDRGLQAGADYYLAKGSFHDDTLLDAVIDLIGEANA